MLTVRPAKRRTASVDRVRPTQDIEVKGFTKVLLSFGADLIKTKKIKNDLENVQDKYRILSCQWL